MEVKKGYKRTEVGVIPEDWEVKTIGGLFSISGGFSSSRDQLSDEGFCYLHYGDIHKSNKTYINVEEEYPEIPKLKIDIKSISPKSLLNDGDAVFVDASEDDEGASKHVVIRNSRGIPYISGLHTIVLKSNDDSVVNLYKQFCFQNSNVKKQFKFYAVGTKVTGISKTNIANVQIALPPTKAEQTAIATALSDADALINSLEKLIAKKGDIKQGAMQLLLTGKKRLPGFTGEWGVKRFPDVCWFQEGPGVRNNQFTQFGVKLLNGTNIYKGRLLLGNTDRFISESEAFGPYAHFLVDAGDIVIACSGITVDRFDEKVSFVKKEHLPLCMNTSTMRFKTRVTSFHSVYLYYYLMSNEFKRQIGGQATGSAQLNFGPYHVKRTEITLPRPQEQIAIAAVLSDMDTEIEALEQKLAKCRLIKQGMMQELLTGKTRLI